MKALLICPADRDKVSALAECGPLSNLPILGRSLIEHWLEHLVTLGAKEVGLLASDRPAQVRALVGDGARWGLRVTVQPELRELTLEEARAKYVTEDDGPWLERPNDVIRVDMLPTLPNAPLFDSYAAWFGVVAQTLPLPGAANRLGVQEIRPGVWVGRHTHVAPTAELRAPCWLGEYVHVGGGAVLGPMVVVEDKAYIESGAKVTRSIVGPETFVGRFAQIKNSLACGDTLVNWQLDSCIKVPDSFLLGRLRREESSGWTLQTMGRLTAMVALALTSPLALAVAVRSKWRGQPALHARLAVRPLPAGAVHRPGDTLTYHELNGSSGWLRRWPQLWAIFRGRFHWAGNRPLSPFETGLLSNDFQRLWLAAPLGLISLADVEGCAEVVSDETCAHASYYAVRHDWRLDWSILARAIFLFEFGLPFWKAREQFARLLHYLSAAQHEAH
jgi:hypothetical protein